MLQKSNPLLPIIYDFKKTEFIVILRAGYNKMGSTTFDFRDISHVKVGLIRHEKTPDRCNNCNHMTKKISTYTKYLFNIALFFTLQTLFLYAFGIRIQEKA